MTCGHDFAITTPRGSRPLTDAEDVALVVAHAALLTQVQRALEVGEVPRALGTTFPAGCVLCGASCVLEATLTLRGGRPVIETEFAVLQ